MKAVGAILTMLIAYVALCVSAWIESKVRWGDTWAYKVALCVSAWIESPVNLGASGLGAGVALYASAWIESIALLAEARLNWSHSTRVRGLKAANALT